MKAFVVSCFVVLFLLSACSVNKTPQHQRCSIDVDCLLPMDYAIRSNCPYEGVCIQGECQVACFEYEPVPDVLVNERQVVSCEVDGDCVCDHYENVDFKECKCLSNRCAAVVDYDLLLGKNVSE